ncbi:MAG: hypothetical protein ACSW8G_06540, partial [Bacillota bacterium]
MMKMNKLIAILISFTLAFAFVFTGCDKGKNKSADVSESVAGVEYYHYDVKDFKAMCGELEELAAGDDADAVIAKYDELYDEIVELDTLYAVIYVMYSTDVTNDYYSEEQIYTYDKLQRCSDRLCEVCRKITEGPCADAFKKHVGKDAFESFANYSVLTKRQKKLFREEQE